MIAVLFARHDSIYKTLPDCDVWDAERDARTWPGGCPVIAHPPCRAWGQLRHFANPLPGERELAIWAVEQVRQWGGVLEHPAKSQLWPEAGLPKPGNRDEWGGFSVWICQHWFGHKAEKPTLLYIVGIEPAELPPIPFVLGESTHVIASTCKRRPETTKAEREHTPLVLAEWLREVALRVASTGAGRAGNNRRRSPVSTPAASPKAALHACAAEGGGSFAAPTGHALSIEWNEGRKVWRDDDIMNIIKHASAPEVITGGCICGHGFNDHEHPAAPWMAINSKMMSTELAACKLCDCDMWREPESLMDNDEEE